MKAGDYFTFDEMIHFLDTHKPMRKVTIRSAKWKGAFVHHGKDVFFIGDATNLVVTMPFKMAIFDQKCSICGARVVGFRVKNDVKRCGKKTWLRPYPIFENGDTGSSDHIIPRNIGGTNHEANLALACIKCNTGKGNKVNTSYIGGIELTRFGGLLKYFGKWGEANARFNKAGTGILYQPDFEDFRKFIGEIKGEEYASMMFKTVEMFPVPKGGIKNG